MADMKAYQEHLQRQLVQNHLQQQQQTQNARLGGASNTQPSLQHQESWIMQGSPSPISRPDVLDHSRHQDVSNMLQESARRIQSLPPGQQEIARRMLQQQAQQLRQNMMSQQVPEKLHSPTSNTVEYQLSPSPTATSQTILAPSNPETDKVRIATILDINGHLIKVCVALQATIPQNSQTGYMSDPTYTGCIQRLQQNLAFLAAKADQSSKPERTPPQIQLLSPPPLLSGLPDLQRELMRLYKILEVSYSGNGDMTGDGGSNRNGSPLQSNAIMPAQQGGQLYQNFVGQMQIQPDQQQQSIDNQGLNQQRQQLAAAQNMQAQYNLKTRQSTPPINIAQTHGLPQLQPQRMGQMQPSGVSNSMNTQRPHQLPPQNPHELPQNIPNNGQLRPQSYQNPSNISYDPLSHEEQSRLQRAYTMKNPSLPDPQQSQGFSMVQSQQQQHNIRQNPNLGMLSHQRNPVQSNIGGFTVPSDDVNVMQEYSQIQQNVQSGQSMPNSTLSDVQNRPHRGNVIDMFGSAIPDDNLSSNPNLRPPHSQQNIRPNPVPLQAPPSYMPAGWMGNDLQSHSRSQSQQQHQLQSLPQQRSASHSHNPPIMSLPSPHPKSGPFSQRTISPNPSATSRSQSPHMTPQQQEGMADRIRIMRELRIQQHQQQQQSGSRPHTPTNGGSQGSGAGRGISRPHTPGSLGNI